MKKITLLALCATILCFHNNLYSQWVVGGNALPAGGGALGSNNNRPVIFETNNIERARLLNTSGFWGFGLIAPAAQVHINATAAGTNAFRVDVVGVARMIVASDGQVGIGTTIPDSRLHINSAAGENGLRVQINAATKLLVDNGGGVSVGSSSIPPANGLFVSGNLGVGISTPATKLHITGGVDASLAGNGFLVTGPTTGFNLVLDDNEIIARNNGAAATLTLNNNGGDVIIDGTNAGTNVGINTPSPSSDLHILHSNGFISNGLTIEDNFAAGLSWNIYSATTGELWLSTDGLQKGEFNGTSGAYTAVSDRKFKKDITSLDNVLDRVMKLNPRVYHFNKQQPNERKFMGMIAQEVQPIFPEAVYEHNGKNDGAEDFLTLDYSLFGVIAVKAIQEQQKTITTLEERIAKLESSLNAASSTKFPAGIDASSIMLEQNKPNPFNQATIIRYKIPSGANALINIYDANGAMVKTMRAPESGQAQINAGDLTAGTYTYSLVIDGKPLASKKMVMVK